MRPFTETVSTLSRHTGEITRMIDHQSRSKHMTSGGSRDEILHTDSSRHRSVTPFVTTQSTNSKSLHHPSQSSVHGNPSTFVMDYASADLTASMNRSSSTSASTSTSTNGSVSAEERQSFLNRIKRMDKNTLNVKRCIVGLSI